VKPENKRVGISQSISLNNDLGNCRGPNINSGGQIAEHRADEQSGQILNDLGAPTLRPAIPFRGVDTFLHHGQERLQGIVLPIDDLGRIILVVV
jgi:hypothetical protein